MRLDFSPAESAFIESLGVQLRNKQEITKIVGLKSYANRVKALLSPTYLGESIVI